MENLDNLIPSHPDRKRIYQKFYDLISKYISCGDFIINESIHYNNDDIKKMSINIERGIFNQAIYLYNNSNPYVDTWNEQFKRFYIGKSVIIYNNLNPHSSLKNTTLLNRLLSKEFNEFELCSFTPKQLFPERWNELVQTCIKLEPKYSEKEQVIEDGVFKCGKCKTYKTSYYQLQTRSAKSLAGKVLY
jgi:transcription elongation factor S-II